LLNIFEGPRSLQSSSVYTIMRSSIMYSILNMGLINNTCVTVTS